MPLEQAISNHPDPEGISLHVLKKFYKLFNF
jgi:hypothetical protein